MKKSNIFITIGIIILVVIIIIGIRLFVKAGEAFDEAFVMDVDVQNYMSDNEDLITGEATITSFNIEQLDTTMWTNIDKELINNEDEVQAGQELLNVSNEEANGKIYSTISGKIFSKEGPIGKSYTIYDLNNLGYEIEVDENNISDLKIGQKVETYIVALNDVVYGRICYISKIPQNELIKVKVKLDNDPKIKIGYSVRATVLLDEPIEEITVYDIKNSIPKIGKTVITYKDSGEVYDFSSFEEILANDDIIAMYEQALEEQGVIIDELLTQMEELSSMIEEIQVSESEDKAEELSNYWEMYWKEKYQTNSEDLSSYWNGYWKEYYEEQYNARINSLNSNENDNEGETNNEGN